MSGRQGKRKAEGGGDEEDERGLLEKRTVHFHVSGSPRLIRTCTN